MMSRREEFIALAFAAAIIAFSLWALAQPIAP